VPAELLHAQGVTVKRGERVLVRDASLTAYEGQLLAVIGPNGAGKSSLLKALAGLWTCQGQIALAGTPISGLKPAERAQRIGYVPQRSELSDGIAVYDVVAQARYARVQGLFGFATHLDPVVMRALERVALSGFAERAFDTLSGGEQRRVLTARALASEARVLLLDEPTTGLDVAHVLHLFALLRSLRDEGYALICVLHDLDDVLRHADAALLLAGGRVVAHGPTAEVLNSERVRQIYGVHSHENAALGFSLHGAYP
jgi:iron complex transport system ATP-binding protein